MRKGASSAGQTGEEGSNPIRRGEGVGARSRTWSVSSGTLGAWISGMPEFLEPFRVRSEVDSEPLGRWLDPIGTSWMTEPRSVGRRRIIGGGGRAREEVDDWLPVGLLSKLSCCGEYLEEPVLGPGTRVKVEKTSSAVLRLGGVISWEGKPGETSEERREA